MPRPGSTTSWRVLPSRLLATLLPGFASAPGPSRLLAQVSSALTNNLMQARLAEAGAGGARLPSLVPQLERRIGLFDTAAMPCLVDVGRRATEAALPAIHALLQRMPQLAAA